MKNFVFRIHTPNFFKNLLHNEILRRSSSIFLRHLIRQNMVADSFYEKFGLKFFLHKIFLRSLKDLQLNYHEDLIRIFTKYLPKISKRTLNKFFISRTRTASYLRRRRALEDIIISYLL
jgi:hypothetical protein